MHNTSPSEQVLALARKHLLEFGRCKPGLLHAPLAQSWERSYIAGLSPERTLEKISQSTLREVIDQSHEFLAFAKPIMQTVSEQIKNSHSMLALADKNCTLIHTLGDRSFLDKAAQVALSEGANWQECSVGTNAVGLALKERSAVQVNGFEHFLVRNGFLHCAATPVYSAHGDIAGILDISSDRGQQNSHMLGLAKIAARMIENSWICMSHPQHFQLYLHENPFSVESFSAGLLLISEDGVIDGANQEGLRLLGLNRQELGSRAIASFVNTSASAWYEMLEVASLESSPIFLQAGRPLFVHFKQAQLKHKSYRLIDRRECITPDSKICSSEEKVESKRLL